MASSFHSLRATSTFVIDSWTDEVLDERGEVKIARARLTKTFRGDIEGRSVADIVTMRGPGAFASYCGLERIEGTLAGRKGSFVLKHDATMSAEGAAAAWTVVPGSGTDELASLHGIAQITNEPGGGHTFTLEYELN